MRRFIILVTAGLLMTAMLVASAAPAFARGGNVRFWSPVGTPLPTVACESPVALSPHIGWRNGTCWVFYRVPTSIT
jgi:hypothetical protein